MSTTEYKEMSVAQKLQLPMNHKWKIQSFNKAKTKASCVAYIDARDVMDRLDKVVGIGNWKDSYRRDSKDRLICKLEINLSEEWVGKEDVGMESGSEGEKGEFSDAFKRAAVKWGVGRFLYDMEIKWLDIKMEGGIKKYSYNGKEVSQYKLNEVFK